MPVRAHVEGRTWIRRKDRSPGSRYSTAHVQRISSERFEVASLFEPVHLVALASAKIKHQTRMSAAVRQPFEPPETLTTERPADRDPVTDGFAERGELFRAMFEGHGSIMLLIDPDDGRILHANPAAVRYYGCSLSEIRALSIYAINQLPQDEISQAMAEAKASRQRRFDSPHRLANGEVRHVVEFSSPVALRGRTLLFSIIHDVAERAHAEAAVRASEERYRLLVETSADVIWTVNQAQQFTYVSPAIEHLRGLTPQEALQESMADAVCPEFLPRILDSLRRSEESRKSGQAGFIDHLEIQQPHRDGSRVWVEVITRALYDENGRWTGALGISRNITRRKHAEATLLEYQRQLEAQNLELRKLTVAIEQSGNTVVITDLDGRILYVNPRFEETTGWSAAEALGQNPRILKSGELDEHHYRAMWETIAGGEIWRGEFHNKRKNGSLYWEAATIAPVVDADGRITNYIAIKEDITERKEAQEALSRYAQQLEAQNAELDAYAHTVAHDLKGPLGVLIGFSELLVDAPTTPEQERAMMLGQINQIGWQMTRIIDALLLLSAARRKHVNIEPLDMACIVTGVRERLAPMIAEHAAELSLTGDWPPALGYAPWVEEVWVNYLSNAMKYGGRPPPRGGWCHGA